MSRTVPAYALALLGGMQPGDPAVTDAVGLATSWERWSALAHARPETRLLVGESEPALLRVLCRHLGWQGNHRPLMRVERRGRSNTRPVWVLRNLTEWGDAPMLDDGPNFYVKLPDHIGTERGYPLAAAVVWFARIARANDTDGSGGDTLEAIERHHELQPLEVLP